MNDLKELFERLVVLLDGADVPFMVAGSFASAVHGLPRATQDIDIVIDPSSLADLEKLVRAMPEEDYYVDLTAARDAHRERSMFNVIDQSSGWKVDFILRKNRAFSREEFARRTRLPLLDVMVFVASPEDTIISKLEWSKMSGGSERQRRDVAGVLSSMGERVDLAYIERWVAELQLSGEWEAAKNTT